MKNYKLEKCLFSNNVIIMRYELYFNKFVATAFIDHKNKEIRPAHGYFYPNNYGKLNKKIADKLKYVFNNN
jgi:hypothetical protein